MQVPFHTALPNCNVCPVRRIFVMYLMYQNRTVCYVVQEVCSPLRNAILRARFIHSSGWFPLLPFWRFGRLSGDTVDDRVLHHKTRRPSLLQPRKGC